MVAMSKYVVPFQELCLKLTGLSLIVGLDTHR